MDSATAAEIAKPDTMNVSKPFEKFASLVATSVGIKRGVTSPAVSPGHNRPTLMVAFRNERIIDQGQPTSS